MLNNLFYKEYTYYTIETITLQAAITIDYNNLAILIRLLDILVISSKTIV